MTNKALFVFSICCCLIAVSPRSIDTGKKKDREDLCQRRSFLLNFTEIGWGHVIHPPIVDIGLCVGQCGSLDKVYHNSIHAEALALLQASRSKNDEKINRSAAPLCTPGSFETISVKRQLGKDTFDGEIPQLVVKSCVCA